MRGLRIREVIFHTGNKQQSQDWNLDFLTVILQVCPRNRLKITSTFVRKSWDPSLLLHLAPRTLRAGLTPLSWNPVGISLSKLVAPVRKDFPILSFKAIPP